VRRKITRTNPFYKVPRFAYGYELIPEGVRLLDYGCHDGAFGRRLAQHKTVEYVGVDKNRNVAGLGADGIAVIHVAGSLSFPDEQFDGVTMFEVLEHIHDQNRTLQEVNRVLKPDGWLIVSVPRRHIFSALDVGNLKFRFAWLHRAYYSLTHSAEAYRQRYVQNPDGLIGDIEIEKSWHQHFSEEDMRRLLAHNGFQVEEFDGAGLFTSVFDFLVTIFRIGFLFPQSLRNWDDYRFHYRSLFCTARKV